MTREERLRAKRWNERLRLVTGFLNITAVGTFGLAVTSPLLDHLRFVNGTSTDALAEWGKLSVGEALPWHDYVFWPFALGALMLHGMAHILMRLLEAED